MKIGLLHFTLPPVVAGVERVLAAHAQLFRAHGHDVVEMATQDFAGTKEEFIRRVEAEFLDVLLVHNVFTMPFHRVATEACRDLAASQLPVISWVHDLAATNPYYVIGPEDVLRKHPRGARVVAISEERAEAYRRVTGFPDVTVIPNGVNVFADFPNNLASQLRGAFPILFHPTRLLRRKNIGLGIHVVAELKKRGLVPRLLISGAAEPFSGNQAEYRGELDELIREHGLESEVFFLSDTTPLGESDIQRLYAISDALFFPSEQEGFGLPVLEAGLQGLPLFVSDTQPLACLARQNGLAFPLSITPEVLAAQIADYFKHSASSHVRQVIRRDFDWQGIYEKHILPLFASIHPH